MKAFGKKSLSLLIVLGMVFSLFTGLTIQAGATAADHLTLNVMGKDGTTVEWTETWYFQDGTKENNYMDAKFTKNVDGSGDELNITKNFADYKGFEDYDALLYSGYRYKGNFPCIAVCKRGILLEDMINYVETQSGYSNLRGGTGIQMFDPTGWKLPNSTDPATDGKYNEFIWGNAENRYYYPGLYEHSTTFNISASADYINPETAIEVPSVMSMVGYYYNTAGSSVDDCLSNADTDRSLRLFFGTSTTSSEGLSSTSDIAGNMGNYSGYNIQNICFYPECSTISVTGGTANGTEGTDGYEVTTDTATVTSDDNWFKASEGEEVTLTASPADGYTVSSLSVTEDSEDAAAVAVSRSGNDFTFTMPDCGVNVAVDVNDLSDPNVHKITLPDELDGIWSVTASAPSGSAASAGTVGTAPDGQTVTVTVARADDAVTSSIGGITIKDADKKDVSFQAGSTDKDSLGNVKSAVYTFVMPSSDVTVGLKENYSDLKISEQAYPRADTVEVKTFTRAQLAAMDEEGDFYYGGFDSTPAVMEGKGSVSVALTDMLNAAGVEFLPGDSIIFTSADGSQKTMTYTQLYSSGRYYFPALYTGTDWPSRSNGKILCLPYLIITGAQAESASYAEGENIDTVPMNSAGAYQLVFGMTMDEFSLNSDATPSAEALTASGYVKNITSITVDHAYNYDVTWYEGHESDESYTLNDEEDLRGFAAIANGTAVDSDYNTVGQDNFAGKTVTLGADISLTSNWTPIGLATVGSDATTHSPVITAGSGFAGTFNGDGHSISGLSIKTAGSGIGLFGYIAPTGIVENVTLLGAVNVSGSFDAIGAVAGYNSGTITNVVNKASVINSNGFNVGGIAGFNDKYYMTDAVGLIENCANEGDISSNNSKVGGITGENSGTVKDCYNSGIVNSTGAKAGAGGIVGRNGNNNTAAETGIVVDCYNLAAITGSSKWSGGIAGFNNAKSSITNCYTTGGTSYTGGYANPIAGNQEGGENCSNNYSLSGLSHTGSTESEVGITKTADEMRSDEMVSLLGASYKANGGCYPVLSWQMASGHSWDSGVVSVEADGTVIKTYTCTVCGEVKTEIVSTPSGTGSITEGLNLSSTVWDGTTVDVSWYIGHESDTSYTINTAAELAGVAAIDNGLVNDDCKIYTGTSVLTASQWNDSDYVYNATGTHGSCNRATDDYSYGVDDFNGKTLNLTADIDMSVGNYMPIGGQYLMTDEDTDTKIGSSFCGVFNGNEHNVTIECKRHCEANYGDGESVGFIGRLGVHDNDPVSMRPAGAGVYDLAIFGSVTANRSIGGIVGKIGKTDGGAEIARCANFASISGTDAKGTGGICGAGWNGGEIRDCYNSGSIFNSHNSYGGIVGSNEIAIVNCYNIGSISGVGTSAAIATENGSSTYENCYWLNTSADMGVFDIYPDGVISKTSTEMKSADFLTALGNAYAEDTNNINDGYPVLKWQNPSTYSSGSSSSGSTASTEVSTTTSVSNGTAKTTVTEKSVTSSISAAAKEKTDSVSIKADTNGKTADSTNVNIPKNSFGSIAEANLNLNVETADGTNLTLTPEMLTSVKEKAAGDTLNIIVKPEATSEAKEIVAKTNITDVDFDNSLTVSIKIKSDDKEISSFSGSLTIDLPVDSANYTAGQSYRVIQISSDNTADVITGKCVNVNGKLYVRMAVSHLSTFVVTDVKTVSYDDVASNAWYYDAVYYVTNRNLMDGTADNAFSPDAGMTRAMLVTVLYRMDGSPAVTAENTFTDVKAGEWYTNAVLWANANGIVEGYGDGIFGTMDNITREQLSTILYRYAQYKKCDVSVGEDTNILSYDDAQSISEYAIPAMQWACGSGVIDGTTDTVLSPKGTATRAQTATMLQRFAEKVMA